MAAPGATGGCALDKTLHFDLTLDRPGGFRLSAAAQVPLQGVTAVFGPSGSGKTTLLRALAGIEDGVTGQIAQGNETWHQGHARLRPAHLRGIAMLFQDARLFPHLTVADNIRFGQGLRGAETRVEEGALIADLGLEALLPLRPVALSGGERQKVALARAVLSAPDLILLDEPFSAVDLSGRAALQGLLGDILSALSLPAILVSHSVEEVTVLADRVHGMTAGVLGPAGPFACGTQHQVFEGVVGATPQGPEVHLTDGGVLRGVSLDLPPDARVALRIDTLGIIPFAQDVGAGLRLVPAAGAASAALPTVPQGGCLALTDAALAMSRWTDDPAGWRRVR